MILEAFLGLLTGTLLGLLGGGGSIIAVPILVYFLGMQAKSAIGISLIIVGLASILAALSHLARRQLIFRAALLFGLAGIPGSFVGAWVAGFLSDTVQLSLFALLMLFMGILMFRQRAEREVGKADSNSNRPSASLMRSNRIRALITSGVGAGFLTGLLGVGGGFIIVPALILVVGLPVKKAIGTSLVIIGINSLAGALAYATAYDSHLKLAGGILPYAAATIVSAPVAGYLAYYLEADKLKKAFAGFLLLLSIWMLAKQTSGI